MKIYSYNLKFWINNALGSKMRLFLFLFITAITSIVLIYLFSVSAVGFLALKNYAVYYYYGLAIGMSILFSLNVMLNVHAYKSNAKSGTKITAVSIVSAVIPTSTCCTSVVPMTLSLFGASTPFILNNAGKLQSFFSVYEPVFFIISIALSFVSMLIIAKNMSRCCRI